MAGKIKADTIQGESQLKLNIGETTYITVGGASWNVALPMNAQSTFVSTGAATMSSTLSVTGATTLSSTLGVTGATTLTDATITGNLTVSGATTYVNTSTLIVQDKNIEIANSATPTDALADGAGITVKGDSDKTLTWATATKSFTFNQGLDIQRVIETVTANATAINANTTIDVLSGSISNYTANVAANWTLNVRANSTTRLDAVMGTNDSMTIAYLATQLGSNTFYQSAMQIDGASVTPKWQGGTAPSAGNATSIDLYAFTIIKTAANTYTVLGSQTQYA
jgi:hypothetical protein